MVYTCNYNSFVGKILLAERDGALTGLWIEGQKYFLASIQEEMKERSDSAALNRTKEWLDSYFKGEKPPISELTLAPMGSEFRKAVWKILCEVPYGETITYGEIARQLSVSRGASSKSAQAVGQAVAHNPISIIIPCHRAVGTNGSLTGYAGGIERKIRLLKHEGVDMDRLFVPGKGTAL